MKAAGGGVAVAATVKAAASAAVPIVMAKTGTIVAGAGTMHGVATVATQAVAGMGVGTVVVGGAAVGYAGYWAYKSSPHFRSVVDSAASHASQATSSAFDMASTVFEDVVKSKL